MKKDTQSRKYQLTINNPQEHGLTHEIISELLKGLQSLKYFCMADEVGDTYHTHVFCAFNAPVRFSTIKNLFQQAHIESAKGTSQQNRDYISKSGKWEKSEKHGTSIPNTFEEFGDLPIERQGQRTDLGDLYQMVKDGLSNYEIIENNADYILNIEKLDRVRLTVKTEEYKNVFRKLEITYVYGSTGIGKTRSVMEKYGYENVYRVTNYRNPFDSYQGQDVIIFDEFSSQIRIESMNTFLEGYPIALPCRYADKQACYTKVYIISNINLGKQYIDEKLDIAIRMAFWRRIDTIIHMQRESDGTVTKDISKLDINSAKVEGDSFLNIFGKATPQIKKPSENLVSSIKRGESS